jgi:hypothetical protein
MREIETKFELFDTAHDGAGDLIVRNAAGTGIARLAETQETAREFKNSGNKARMLMKTKHITFLDRANQGFWRASRHKPGGEGSKGNLGKRGQAPASQDEEEYRQFVG